MLKYLEDLSPRVGATAKEHVEKAKSLQQRALKLVSCSNACTCFSAVGVCTVAWVCSGTNLNIGDSCREMPYTTEPVSHAACAT